MRPLVLATSLAVLAALALAGCNRQPLPALGSVPEQIYVEKCGRCHRPYNPHSMTAAMWQVQVNAMEGRMVQAGMPPLSVQDRRIIMSYLIDNAGHH